MAKTQTKKIPAWVDERSVELIAAFTSWLDVNGVDYAQSLGGRWLIEGADGWMQCETGDEITIAKGDSYATKAMADPLGKY